NPSRMNPPRRTASNPGTPVERCLEGPFSMMARGSRVLRGWMPASELSMSGADLPQDVPEGEMRGEICGRAAIGPHPELETWNAGRKCRLQERTSLCVSREDRSEASAIHWICCVSRKRSESHLPLPDRVDRREEHDHVERE